MDRLSRTVSDIVCIESDRREPGKQPSRAVALHQAIYEQHFDVHNIISAQPSHAMAYAVSSAQCDTRTSR
jgi:L-fuculose-phosphate aldolase